MMMPLGHTVSWLAKTDSYLKNTSEMKTYNSHIDRDGMHGRQSFLKFAGRREREQNWDSSI